MSHVAHVRSKREYYLNQPTVVFLETLKKCRPFLKYMDHLFAHQMARKIVIDEKPFQQNFVRNIANQIYPNYEIFLNPKRISLNPYDKMLSKWEPYFISFGDEGTIEEMVDIYFEIQELISYHFQKLRGSKN